MQTDDPDNFFPILRLANAPCAWPGPGPWHPSAGLHRFGVWLHRLSRLNFSWLCSRPTSVPIALQARPHSQGSCSSLRILGLLHPCVGGLQGVTPVTSPLPAFSCNSPQQHTPGAKAFGRKLSLHSFLSILHKEATWRNKSVRRKQ